MLQVLLNGISQGSLYGLLGIAIVLILRVSGVANFAQGEIGMLCAFAGYFASVWLGLPGWAAFPVGIVTGAIMSVFLYLTIIEFRRKSEVNSVVRTLGIDTVILSGAAALWAGHEPYRFPDLVPVRNITVGPVVVSSLLLAILVLTTALVILLHLLFTRTRLGLHMRALAQHRDWAMLAGINPRVVLVGTWLVAGVIAAAAAMLYAPLTYLSTAMMGPFLVKAFAAAIVGGVDNWYGVLLGGLCIGVVEAYAGTYVSYLLQPAIAFTILTAVLVFKPEGMFSRTLRQRV